MLTGHYQSVDLTRLKDLGVADPTKGVIRWTGPMVYSDVLPKPVTYSVNQRYNVLGLIALGKLQLPEIGDSGSKEISSGTVVYFRASDPVVYRSCGGGRILLFYFTF